MLLYHGSAFKTDVLKPGIEHTGELIQWDEIESNEWLYLTTDRDTAIRLGFASAFEKRFLLINFSITINGEDKSTIRIKLKESKQPTMEEIEGLNLYLYTVMMSNKIKKNNNPNNGLDTEYKTKEHLYPIAVEKIDVKEFLARNKLVITLESLSKPHYITW